MNGDSDSVILNNNRGDSVVIDEPQQGESFPVYREHPKHRKPNNLTILSNRYPIYAYLYNISDVGIIQNQDLINFDDVINRMIRYSRSLWNDFYEETREISWMRINALFFENAFFLPELYVHYDEENEKYELYLKCGDDVPDKMEGHHFINIQTQNSVYFSDPEADLVQYIWSGRKEDRYGSWFKLAYSSEFSWRILQSLKALYNIRMVVTPGANYEADYETLEGLKKDLFSLSIFIKNTDNRLIIDPLQTPFITGADLLAYAQAMYLELDREISEFGRVANLNPKPERKTAGENYIAIDRQVDHLRGIYDSLELMALEMEERGWPSLSFQVNTEQALGMVAEPEGEQQPEQKDATKVNEQVQ